MNKEIVGETTFQTIMITDRLLTEMLRKVFEQDGINVDGNLIDSIERQAGGIFKMYITVNKS